MTTAAPSPDLLVLPPLLLALPLPSTAVNGRWNKWCVRYVPAATPARNTGNKRSGDHDEPAGMVDDAALDEAADRVERVGVRVADKRISFSVHFFSPHTRVSQHRFIPLPTARDTASGEKCSSVTGCCQIVYSGERGSLWGAHNTERPTSCDLRPTRSSLPAVFGWTARRARLRAQDRGQRRSRPCSPVDTCSA